MAPADQPEDTEFEEIDYDNPPFALNDSDRAILATRDEDFHRITWQDLQTIIARNTLADLKRAPNDLRRYLAWSDGIKQRWGSVTAFVLAERLRWDPLPPSSDADADGPPRFAHASEVPFEVRGDFAVLRNDWPYGLAPGIDHLVAWTKTPIAVVGDDAAGADEGEKVGDVTAASRRRIEHFVHDFFARELGADGDDRVLWFKNWVALQSVRGVDHVHILVRDAPPDLVEKWLRRLDLEIHQPLK